MTNLYNGIMKHAEPDHLDLSHKVWDPTPWVIDVFIGERDEIGNGVDEQAIRSFCEENFGVQSWPIHDRPADWYRGGATVDGWTWLGFKTKVMMEKFIDNWPNNTKE